MRLAEETIEALFDLAKAIDDEALRAAVRKFALKSQTRAQLTAMVKLAQHQPRIVLSPDALDADPLLLGVLNGVIDLRTVTFREGRREDYISKRCAVAFDRNAQCPAWRKFQTKIAGGEANADLVAYKQRVSGLLLTGEVVEILFICHGEGANGKSSELETLHTLLGDYAHAADAALLIDTKEKGGGPTPEIVALKGKRALFINETKESDRLNEARVKYLAGDDTLSGRDLFEKTINFRPTHKAILRTNHKPKIRGTDLGIWRRIHYLPYLVTIVEQIEHFRQKVLEPELPGILNWMLDGLVEYQGGGLRPPEIVCKATEKYRRDMDIVGRWIDETCERSTIGAKLFLSEIHKAYAKWAADEIGWTASMQKLAEELRRRGFEINGDSAKVVKTGFDKGGIDDRRVHLSRSDWRQLLFGCSHQFGPSAPFTTISSLPRSSMTLTELRLPMRQFLTLSRISLTRAISTSSPFAASNISCWDLFFLPSPACSGTR
jgi:putative DNA primase/helicase